MNFTIYILHPEEKRVIHPGTLPDILEVYIYIYIAMYI